MAGANLKLEVRRLVTGEEAAVFSFLNRQPLRNVAMIGFILDHGLESERNRGTFYGCFRNGWLVGVALIGHFVVLSGSEETVPVFADVARLWHEPEIRVLLGDPETIEAFGRVLNQPSCGLKVQGAETHLLWLLTQVSGEAIEIEPLRQARIDEAEEVAQAHARAYLEQVGVDPLEQDPQGFRQRVLSRIELGRVWIVRDAKGIAFKADVTFDTGEAIYLEGVWARPELRGSGWGSKAMKALCQRLLSHHHVVCLFSRMDDERAKAFYQRLGFQSLSPYQIVRYAKR
jgi:ribosomal protein S18 acetylase RimI-like enzyme